MDKDQKIRHLEAKLAVMLIAARRVLSDIKDDRVVEYDDMSILSLKAAVDQISPDVFESVVMSAQRVYSKFGIDSDWSEWKDLGSALGELANWPLPLK